MLGRLPDPELPSKFKADTRWAPTSGQVVVDSFAATDVVLGALGDCYLASGLASLAQVRPDVLRDAVKDNGDGTYTVRFYKDSFLGLFGRSKKPVYVTVDGDMPTRDGKTPRFTRGRDPKELWPMLVEKAYAKLDGSYGKVGVGGAPTTLWQALTGKSGSMQLNAFKRSSVLFADIKNALAEQRPVAASTSPLGGQGEGLSKGHVYSVLAVSERDGKQYVTLRNPWGHGEPGNDGRDDGVFELEVGAFKKRFLATYYGG